MLALKTKKLPWIKQEETLVDQSFKKEDLSPFAFLKSIQGKVPDMDFSKEEVTKAYSPYMMNRIVSMNPSLVLVANAMNMTKDIPADKHFLFYKTIISKNNSYFQYLKKQESQEEKFAECYSRYFEFGSRDANLASKLLSLEQKQEISKKYDSAKIR